MGGKRKGLLKWDFLSDFSAGETRTVLCSGGIQLVMARCVLGEKCSFSLLEASSDGDVPEQWDPPQV